MIRTLPATAAVALALLAGGSGCSLAQKSDVLETEGRLAEGHEKLAEVQNAELGAEEKAAIKAELAALRIEANRLEEEAKSREVRLGDVTKVASRIVVGIGDYYSGGVVSDAIASVNRSIQDSKAAVEGAIDSLEGADEQVRSDLRATAEGVVEVDRRLSLLEGLSGDLRNRVTGVLENTSGLEKRLASLSESTNLQIQGALSRGVDEERLKDIFVGAKERAETVTRKMMYDLLGLDAKGRNDADGLGLEELLALLLTGGVTGGASVYTARKISPSGKKIEETNHRLEKLVESMPISVSAIASASGKTDKRSRRKAQDS